MSSPYAIPVSLWGEKYFNVSVPTAYRYINSEDPPPVIMLNGRRRVAVGSPKYQEWLDRRTTSTVT
ncbi:MAG: hypothetical protein O6944_03645 [Gammaproteobacteria bacterium]|nr:hypothetical protein [Gammaproteobacteria bacterium]